MMMLPSDESEAAFIRALDASKIETWYHFEYVLSFVLENRFLRVF